tara:strand:+ start:381 stop:773 length:393 start_codon:yes stop_codon:yes gene_type:complete
VAMKICDNWDCKGANGRHQFDTDLYDKCPNCGAKQKKGLSTLAQIAIFASIIIFYQSMVNRFGFYKVWGALALLGLIPLLSGNSEAGTLFGLSTMVIVGDVCVKKFGWTKTIILFTLFGLVMAAISVAFS